MTCTIGGMPVVNATIAMGHVGVWHVEQLEASGETAPAQGTNLTLSAYGVNFECAVVRSTALAGRVKMRLAGGKGRLSEEVAAGHWVKPTVGSLIRGILASCGETLSPVAATAAKAVNGATIDPTILTVQLQQWKRNAVPASRALQAICDNQGLIWRVLRDGTVWVGVEAFPSQKVTHTLIDEDWSSGVIDFAPDAPDLKPGVTFRDQQIRYVVHHLDKPPRSEAALSSPGDLLDRFLAGIRQEIQFSRSYPAEVVAQNSDGTLQLRPTDQKLKGQGLNKVPIRSGVPGFKSTVVAGAIVSLEFENGDPSQPRASLWEHDASKVAVVEFEPGGLGSPGCRVGDTLEVSFPMGLPISGVMGAIPFSGVVTITVPARAVLTGPGNTKFLL